MLQKVKVGDLCVEYLVFNDLGYDIRLRKKQKCNLALSSIVPEILQI